MYSPAPEIPSLSQTKGALPDTSSITIEGDASVPVNQIAIQAIADLEQYWAENYPELYGQDFEQISGGYYAIADGSPAPPCTTEPEEVSGNGRSTARPRMSWPGTARTLLPTLQSKFGDFVIPVVMAHEFGGAIQARSNFTARTVTRELQADCFAGALGPACQGRRRLRWTSAGLRHGAGRCPRPAGQPRHRQD